MRWQILFSGAILLVAQTVHTLNASAKTTPERLVMELYGERLAKVKASGDPSDDIALAREMLMAAADSANPKRLRYILAMEVIKLTAPIGTDETTTLASEALELADKLISLDPVTKGEIELQIARQRLANAKKVNASPEKRSKLAAEMIQKQIVLADVMMRKKKLDKAYALLISAKNTARYYKLYDQQDDVEEAMGRYKQARALSAQISAAKARLERAKSTFDEDAIKSARLSLGLIYLLVAGDITAAEKYLSGSGNSYEKAVSVAAEFIRGHSKLPPVQECNKVVETLGEAARAARNEQARISIATVAARLCRALLEKKPSGIAAVKTRLLLTQMELLSGNTPEDKFLKKLKVNYAGLYGKIRVVNLKEKLVSVSYDFSKHNQRRDWLVDSGQWSVVPRKNILGCRPSSKRRLLVRIANRLRFRADKPLVFTFQVRGEQDLTGILTFLLENDPATRQWPYELRFILGAFRNHESILFERGRFLWRDRRIRVVRNKTYDTRITWDGVKTITWMVNGVVLCSRVINYPKEDIPYSSIYVSLGCGSKPAAFDNVTIQGVVLDKPSQRLRRPEMRTPARPGRQRFRARPRPRKP